MYVIVNNKNEAKNASIILVILYDSCYHSSIKSNAVACNKMLWFLTYSLDVQ